MGKYHIASYSGGKDSTAMLLMSREWGIEFDDIVYVDLGDWVWDEAKDMVYRMAEYIDQDITIIDISDELEEGLRRWGFPSYITRWCTGYKIDRIRDYIEAFYGLDGIVQYVGYNAGEPQRFGKAESFFERRFPLVEHGIDGDMALRICYDHGFDFGGIYEHHSHLSCWCCPFQRMHEVRYLFEERPDLWERLRRMQDVSKRPFKDRYTVYDLEMRFRGEG
ncbi:putative adenine nucleotide alpha hydrolase family protein [Methanobacterium virus PhiF1]|nr:putative adenine nucleotide alpha hydrolase family protein [Methanobacterium virus PhiF1]